MREARGLNGWKDHADRPAAQLARVAHVPRVRRHQSCSDDKGKIELSSDMHT